MGTLEERINACSTEIQPILDKYGLKFTITMESEVKLALEILRKHDLKVTMTLGEK